MSKDKPCTFSAMKKSHVVKQNKKLLHNSLYFIHTYITALQLHGANALDSKILSPMDCLKESKMSAIT